MAEKKKIDTAVGRISGGATAVRTHGHEFYEDIAHKCAVTGGRKGTECEKK